MNMYTIVYIIHHSNPGFPEQKRPPASLSLGQDKMPLVEVPKTMPPYIARATQPPLVTVGIENGANATYVPPKSPKISMKVWGSHGK